MPSFPPRPCIEPGCPNLVRGRSRCPRHQAAADRRWAEKKAAFRQANADRYALYRSPEWRRLRSAVLAEESSCRECGEAATVVDHIVPHLGDLMVFLDRKNCQALCKRCHDRKTSRQDSWNRKRKSR